MKKRGGWNKGKGKVVTWLREHASHAGMNCLKYPFSIDPKLGYALFGLDGEILYAHRFMCELKNGPPPTPEHEAAHTCGNAHMGCINPNHLEWKTHQENAQDRLRHGNYSNRAGGIYLRQATAGKAILISNDGKCSMHPPRLFVLGLILAPIALLLAWWFG